jgi:hypothetical protein
VINMTCRFSGQIEDNGYAYGYNSRGTRYVKTISIIKM